MQKTILIFGGGENQLTLIKAARELGVRAVVIDPNPEAPGKPIADHFEVVGPSDYDLTKRIAIKYKVNGIVTGQMENPLRLMAKLAKELCFVFPSPEVIERCRNKYLMKRAFLENKIPCARGILVKWDEPIVPSVLESYKYPLIIKPVDSYSSKGVYRVESFDELIQYDNYSHSFSSDKSIIVEEFIEGPEYSIESITFKGETQIIQFTEKIITSYPHTVELGHIQPAELTEEQKYQVSLVVIDAIKALGIDNSATHTELKLTGNGPIIIEIGARLGGDYISSYLTLYSTGVNMDKAAIQVALGVKPDLLHKHTKYAYIKYLELPAGKVIKKIENWAQISTNPKVIYMAMKLQKGQKIPTITDSSKRTGFIIVCDENRSDLIHTADKLANNFSDLVEYEN